MPAPASVGKKDVGLALCAAALHTVLNSASGRKSGSGRLRMFRLKEKPMENPTTSAKQETLKKGRKCKTHGV